jgi:hypothetical protein
MMTPYLAQPAQPQCQHFYLSEEAQIPVLHQALKAAC